MNALSLTGRRWRLPPADESDVIGLSRALCLPPVAARCLLRRSHGDDRAAWMAPAIDHLHDPWSMLGMEPAVDRVRRALRDRERVRIVTDYDVDGTTSSLILQHALWLAGPPDARRLIDFHIPHRFDEGYGFSVRAAQAAAEDGVRLVVTADIGVRDHAAVTAAADAGVDVLVCDHHLPAGEAVPADAVAVLCPPQEGCSYPNPALAACGVSLKLAQALLAQHPRRDDMLRSMMKMAAIGTVADVVDLSTLENRAIVALGLDALNRGPHAPGLTALLEVSGLTSGLIEASDLGFRIGPRINAAGRLATATAIVDLMHERDPARARERARAIDRLNAERQGIQEKLTTASLRALPSPAPAFVTLWGPEEDGWHRGVVGIVAARLRDRVHRPVAIAAVAGDEARGSVRSTPGVHAVAALDAAGDLLVKWGGHPVAAGFTVRTAHLPALAQRLAAWTAEHGDDDALAPTLELDAMLRAEDLDWGLVEALQRLGPHGKGNPPPLLQVEGVRAEQARPMGARHVRFHAGPCDAVWWGGAAHIDKLRGPLTLAATPGFNRYNGRTTLRLTVEDARPAPEAS